MNEKNANEAEIERESGEWRVTEWSEQSGERERARVKSERKKRQTEGQHRCVGQ